MDFYTVEEIARKLRMTENAVYQRRRKDPQSLPPHYKEGKHILFPADEYIAWKNNRPLSHSATSNPSTSDSEQLSAITRRR